MAWKRDEIGEYHDGNDNLIAQEPSGWYIWYQASVSSAAGEGPYKTLAAAKARVKEATA